MTLLKPALSVSAIHITFHTMLLIFIARSFNCLLIAADYYTQYKTILETPKFPCTYPAPYQHTASCI